MGNQGNTTSDPEKNELPTPNPILGENRSHEWKRAKISQMKENQERLSPADRPWKNGSSSSFNRKKRKKRKIMKGPEHTKKQDSAVNRNVGKRRRLPFSSWVLEITSNVCSKTTTVSDAPLKVCETLSRQCYVWLTVEIKGCTSYTTDESKWNPRRCSNNPREDGRK